MGVYFPIFRGRQFELIALRDLVNMDALSDKIVPIIEPVKFSSTYLKTIDAFIKKKHELGIIRNPQVGELVNKNIAETDEAKEQLNSSLIFPCLYVTSSLADNLAVLNNENRKINDTVLLCDSHDGIHFYKEIIGKEEPKLDLIPDNGDFRRSIRHNRVIWADHFNKLPKNSDYAEVNDEFFSSDHLYYEEDGYVGFSDYSVIGRDYNESGFAPYAVAIHVVYFNEDNELRIRHFVSDSNNDIRDPARKFAEAAFKLDEWNKNQQLNTIGMREFRNDYTHGIYPGLGNVKKWSIMHHLELMSQHLDGENHDIL